MTLSWPLLILVLDMQRCAEVPLSVMLPEALAGGVGMVILRDRHSPTDVVLRRAETARALVPVGIPFLVNERLDVALAVGADGVHLREHGLSASHVRAQLPQDALVGRSIHSVDAAISAALEPLDYLLVGTMFPTSCKPGHSPEGPAMLHAIRSRVTVPVVGIGGITSENAALVMQAGAQGIAVVTAITHASQPRQVTQQLVRSCRFLYKDSSF